MNPFKLLLLVLIFSTYSLYVYPAEGISYTAVGEQASQSVPRLEDVQVPQGTQDEARLTRYKDMYFIVGKPDTKIQISFKYLLIKGFQVYIGYSQLMVWELFNQTESPYFKDVNFCPDIFYRYAFSDKSFFKTLDFAIFDHDSNGVGHASEHAWSRVYLRSSATTRFSNWSFRWEMKMFVYYNNSIADANKDIRKYTGFWNTRISFVNHTSDTEFLDRISMYLEFYPGGTYSTNFKYGAQEIGAKVRLGWGKFNPWLFVQIYHGYCESLIDYNKENFSYRIGIFF